MEQGDPDETYFGHLTCWSDSFLRCNSRVEGNSVWIFVVRIAAPEGESTSSSHTFCLAMGSSKASHDKVIAHYLKEIIKLMKGKMRYYGGNDGQKRLVNTSFGLALYIADTPERNAILHRLHLGTFGLRSGYAGMVDPVGLPSCQKCFEHRIGKLFNLSPQTQRCDNRCCDWNQLSDSNANHFHKTEGTNYPDKCSHDNPHIFPPNRTCRESHIVPIKQTFAKMSSGTKAALHEYSTGTWSTQGILKYYLSTIGVNSKTQDKVCKAGGQSKTM